MDQKVGRNDPCPCGSGKKYKQCCLNKKKMPLAGRIKQAVWIKPKKEAPEAEAEGPLPATPHLIERAYGAAIFAASEAPPFQPREQQSESTALSEPPSPNENPSQ